MKQLVINEANFDSKRNLRLPLYQLLNLY